MSLKFICEKVFQIGGDDYMKDRDAARPVITKFAPVNMNYEYVMDMRFVVLVMMLKMTMVRTLVVVVMMVMVMTIMLLVVMLLMTM